LAEINAPPSPFETDDTQSIPEMEAIYIPEEKVREIVSF
jgi:hypothetical protein